MSDSKQIVDGIKITMDNTYRSEQRMSIRQKYLDWLGKIEELMPDIPPTK